MINITPLSVNAKIPTRGSDESAGLDLHTVDSVTIPPGHRALLKTGLSMSMPKGYVGLIWPRSKLAAKMGIDVLAGVVDSDYRGEVMISLLNTGLDTVEIRTGDKVAQMIIQRHYSDMQINVVDELDKTMRGKAGVNCSENRLR
jgi:dUTP pyrophosphatase